MRQDHRQLGGLFGADDVVEPAKVVVEDCFIQKHEGSQRLVLRRGGDLMGHGEVREKLLHLGGTHRLRMPFVMEQDESPDPLHIGVFRAETIVLGADSHTHLLQEPGRLIPRGRTVVLDHRVLLSDNARKPFVYYTYVHYSKNALTCLGAVWGPVQSKWNVRRNATAGQRELSGTSGNKLTGAVANRHI